MKQEFQSVILSRSIHVCVFFIFYLSTGSFQSSRLFSQDVKKIDSLNTALQGLVGESRFDILRELFAHYAQYDYQQSLRVAEEAVTVAKGIGDDLLIVRAYRMQGYALTIC